VRLYKSQTHARTANDHDRQRSREFRYLVVWPAAASDCSGGQLPRTTGAAESSRESFLSRETFQTPAAAVAAESLAENRSKHVNLA